jgi:hypothetical protein
MQVSDNTQVFGPAAVTTGSHVRTGGGCDYVGTSFVDLTSLATTTASSTSWFADDDLVASDDEDYYSMMHTMGAQSMLVRKPRKPRAPRAHKVDFVPPTFLRCKDKESEPVDDPTRTLDVVVKQEPADPTAEPAAPLSASPPRLKRKRDAERGSADSRVAVMASAVGDERVPIVAAVPALPAKANPPRVPKGPRASSKPGTARAHGTPAARPSPTARATAPGPGAAASAAAVAAYPVSIPRDARDEDGRDSGAEDEDENEDDDSVSLPPHSAGDIVPWARPLMVNEGALGETLRLVTSDSGVSAARCGQIEKLRATRITFTRHDRKPTQPKHKVDPTLKYFPLKQCVCRQCLDYDPNRARRKVHKKNRTDDAAGGASTGDAAVDIRDIDFYCKECDYVSTHNTFFITSPSLQFNCEQCRKRVAPSELPW